MLEREEAAANILSPVFRPNLICVVATPLEEPAPSKTVNCVPLPSKMKVNVFAKAKTLCSLIVIVAFIVNVFEPAVFTKVSAGKPSFTSRERIVVPCARVKSQGLAIVAASKITASPVLGAAPCLVPPPLASTQLSALFQAVLTEPCQ